VESLKLKKAWADLDEETIRNFCAIAHKILEAAVEAVCEILKSYFNKNDAQNICLLEFVFKIGIP
jgi:DNA-binding MltR family transcriptional regulator